MSSFHLARRSALFVATVGVLVCSSSGAFAGTLQGRLVDSLTGTPIPGANVRVLGTHRETETDESGSWKFELPEGEYEIAFDKTLGGESHQFRLIRQRVPQDKPADSTLSTTYYLERGAERLNRPRGTPVERIDHPSNRDRGPIDLDDALGDREARPGALTLPDQLPRTIRVARYENPENCSNSIVAIEEVRLDEYVRGVLPPEIGVFQNLNNIEETYKAFGLAAKSYGLYFMLVYGPNNRRTTSTPKPPNDYTWYHIDDTPCNQRYSDKRLTITTQAIDTQAGRILVKEGAPDTLDQYEYAASCGEHGTRPEYQDTIIDDTTPTQSCVGDWCGHDTCAGHEDHPEVSGSDSCLVRGICQWGAAEWAEAGKNYEWMLDHYQPNLQIRRAWDGDGEETVELKGYVHTDPDDVMGTGLAGSTVELSGGGRTTTNSDGKYAFSDVELSRGTVTVTASKEGYESHQTSKTLMAGQTNWASIRLVPTDGAGEPDEDNDSGPRPDTNVGSENGDAGSDSTGRDAGRFGGLGPLVTNSGAGRSSGCSCSTSTGSGGPAPLAVLACMIGLGCALRRW